MLKWEAEILLSSELSFYRVFSYSVDNNTCSERYWFFLRLLVFFYYVELSMKSVLKVDLY